MIEIFAFNESELGQKWTLISALKEEICKIMCTFLIKAKREIIMPIFHLNFSVHEK